MEETTSLGQKLKSLREEKKLKQPDVANHLNITRQNYSSYENNRSQPPIDTLREIALFFNVSSDYLIGISDNRNPVEIYSANNINGSNVVQGSGSVTIGESEKISKEELELLRIYNELDVRSRAKLLNTAFELEDERKK